MGSLVVRLGSGVDLRVEIPAEKEREIAGAFLAELRPAIEQSASRYAPGHRGFLMELRELVLVGIDPRRLGRGGVHTFVERVAYRMWDERRRDLDPRVAVGLAPEAQVSRPPQTEEMPAVRPRGEDPRDTPTGQG